MKQFLKDFWSLITLIAANTLPIIGVIYWKWDIFGIVYVYFLETVIIGLFGFLKILYAKGLDYTIEHSLVSDILLSQFFPRLNSTSSKAAVFGSFFVCFFFYIVLLFCLLLVIFTPDNFPKSWNYSYLIVLPGFFISHLVSFWQNYINKKEYLIAVPYKQIAAPFDRVLLMILVFSASAFTIYRLNLSVLTVLALIGIKVVLDINAHYREHRRYRDVWLNYILVGKISSA